MNIAELLRDLIRISSVNPDGDPGTEAVGEKNCAEFIARFLKEQGAEAWLDEVEPDRPNVVGRFPSDRAGKPRLLFAPHTDTVSVMGMTIDPFSGELRDGNIWGRGASDTKGPMAAMLHALSACKDILPTLSHEIWFAGLMSEETGQFGAKALAAKEHFDFVVVGEPTSLQIVHTHKGSAWLTLRSKGKAAHASTPQAGDNAIYKMLDALNYLRGELEKTFSPLHDEVLGAPTYNFGIVNGGSRTNIVPDHCEARIDMRTIPGQDITPLLDGFAKKFPEIEMELKRSEPLRTEPTDPVIQKLQAAGAQCTGAPWFCDAAIFAQKGMPAVAIGPGSIAQAHTCDEFISLSDLEEGTRFFQQFLKSLT